jgi:hypothetical protein
MLEAAIVGGICLVVTLAVFITYARFSVEEFYNISKTGWSGAAGQAIVTLNYPVAFIALALLSIAVSSLIAVREHPRMIVLAAITAAALCLVAGYPGVVKQSDLDFKPVNLLPAVGVGITTVLVAMAIRQRGFGPAGPWQPSDTVAAVVGALFLFGGLPWVLGVAGFYIESVPLLGRIFMSRGTENGVEEIYVHLGTHHGFSGLLFLISALVLRRVIGLLQPFWLDRALSAYVAFMLAYGIANFIQDGWYEQIVKRGWSSYDIPNTTVPALTPVWGLIVLGAVVFWFVMFREPATRRRSSGRAIMQPS